MKARIEYRKSKYPGGYIGMNAQAAKALHLKYVKKHPDHIIEIYKKLPHKVKVNTIHHEQMEEYLMKNKHFSYHHAHRNALRFEKFENPFPKKDIKLNLQRMGFKIR